MPDSPARCIVRIFNDWDHTPAVPCRGRYASISIAVEALPMDMDILDLEIRIGGVRANAVSISEPDKQGLQQILAPLPALEQTGLIPVDLHWFGERLTFEPAHVHIVPPGPVVPRIVAFSMGPVASGGHPGFP